MIADALGNGILDAILNATPYSVATFYVSLHDGVPTAGANEISGALGYTRQLPSMGAAASKACANDGAVEFEDLPATTLKYAGAWTAVSGGTFLGYAALDEDKVVAAYDVYRFNIGDFTWVVS